MKRLSLLTGLLLLLIWPASALARHKPPAYVPPSQSAASQYTEVVPTAGGNTPSGRVHASPSGPTGPGSHGGGGTGGSSSGSPSANSSIPASTLKAMSAAGATGASAASVAAALAPASSGANVQGTHSSGASHRSHSSAAAPPRHTTAQSAPTVPTSSATGQVVSTLGGSDAGGGIGTLLPIILIGSLVLASGIGLTRLRRGGATS